jgi:acyl carrier protein
MADNNIERRLLAHIQEQLGLVKEPKLTDRFVADLGCDSLDLVEIAMALEGEFCIEIDDEEGVNCVSVADAVALVNKSNPS